MASPVPSREALRALSRLCRRGNATPLRYHSATSRHPPTTTTLTTHRVTLPKSFSSTVSTKKFIRAKSNIVDTPDPQHDSSAALPDITNFYTLFPQTIPHGPPQPPSRISDSSTELSGEQPASSFYINPRDLRKEFLQLQSLYHPDKYPAGSTAHQRAYALSTLLNNAYKTLSDPLLRAQYVLQLLYDVDVTSEDNSAHPTDSETLMLVMEAQEELEGAAGKDGAQMVERLKDENKARIKEAEKELGEAFGAGDVDGARDWSVKLKYWKSLESGLNDWEPGKEVRLMH